MDKLVEPMMEHICDSLCRHPAEAPDQETLDRICAECEMGKYICGILNEYNRINNFQGSQCEKLLEELGRERHKNSWIPVEERLPKEKNLISDKVLIAQGVKDKQISFGWLRCGTWVTSDMVPFERQELITHWMPSPGNP